MQPYKEKVNKMKLWRVTNGWMGNGDVHVYVIATTEERARELGAATFKAEKEEERAAQAYMLRRKPLDERYWTNVQAELVCWDTTVEWVGVPSD